MGFFDFLKQPDINDGVSRFKAESKGVLLDVRTKEEYSQGHIPDSINVPLDELGRVSEKIKSQALPIFVYCHSGTRSGQAVMLLKRMGYTNSENIGGIINYKGEVLR